MARASPWPYAQVVVSPNARLVGRALFAGQHAVPGARSLSAPLFLFAPRSRWTGERNGPSFGTSMIMPDAFVSRSIWARDLGAEDRSCSGDRLTPTSTLRPAALGRHGPRHRQFAPPGQRARALVVGIYTPDMSLSTGRCERVWVARGSCALAGGQAQARPQIAAKKEYESFAFLPEADCPVCLLLALTRSGLRDFGRQHRRRLPLSGQSLDIATWRRSGRCCHATIAAVVRSVRIHGHNRHFGAFDIPIVWPVWQVALLRLTFSEKRMPNHARLTTSSPPVPFL